MQWPSYLTGFVFGIFLSLHSVLLNSLRFQSSIFCGLFLLLLVFLLLFLDLSGGYLLEFLPALAHVSMQSFGLVSVVR